MKPKAALIAGLTVALVIVAALVVGRYRATQENGVQTAQARREAAVARGPDLTSPMEKPAALESLPAEAKPGAPDGTAQPMLEGANAGVNVKTQKLAQTKGAGAKAKEVIQDPLARDALALVGVDPEAEMYWFAAIHDPALPKSERQDLIDDLNEEGLSDPKHPTVDDLPLLMSRIGILGALVPTLPDEFDWKESYDDLVNLVDMAMGGGKPVH